MSCKVKVIDTHTHKKLKGIYGKHFLQIDLKETQVFGVY